MRYILFLLVLAFSANAKVNIDGCISLHSDAGKIMFLSMLEDFDIQKNSVTVEESAQEFIENNAKNNIQDTEHDFLQ